VGQSHGTPEYNPLKEKDMKYGSMEEHIFLTIPVLYEQRLDHPLNSIDCLVYGYLLFLVRKQNFATQSSICNSLRLDRQAGKASLERLAGEQLVIQKDGGWVAQEPRQQDLFRTQKNAEGAWYERFVYDKVYLPVSSAVLPVRANLLFWHLVRLGKPVEKMPGHLRIGGEGNKYLTDVYLARGLNCDRKTAHRCLRRLRKLGLINTHPYAKGYAVGVFPLKQNVGLWRRTWQQQPKVAAPLTMQELFAVPSPAVVRNDHDLERSVLKTLRIYEITGKVAQDLTYIIVEGQICPTVWQPMLKRAQSENLSNLEKGKSRWGHCGFLFAHLLREYCEVRSERRRHSYRYPTSEEWRLGDILHPLGLTVEERRLIGQVMEKMNLYSDSGSMIPANCEFEQIAAIAAASKGSKKAFKSELAHRIFGEHVQHANDYQWYREWTLKEDEVGPNTHLLAEAGVPSFALHDTRLGVLLHVCGSREEDHGAVAARVNAATVLACWQEGQYRDVRVQDRILAAANDLAVSVGCASQPQPQEHSDNLSPASRKIFELWMQGGK
jgi:hypothetical protein